jgi:probable rRNA maturation factor
VRRSRWGETPQSPRPGRPVARPVVKVTTRGGPFAGVSAAVVRRRAEKMLSHLELGGVELSVALVDDTTIRELNRAYRHKDKPTDVLAFPLQDGGASRAVGRSPWGRRSPAPQTPASYGGLLGDVILSIETARRQAARHRRPLLAELTMLLAHGLLHLLGHDHQTDAQERKMVAQTRELEAAATARRGLGAEPPS